MNLRVERIPNGRWRENCYVLHRSDQRSLVIDPGGEAPRILKFIASAELSVVGILVTHAHYDHVGAIAEVKAHSGAPCYLHSADAGLLKYTNLYRKVFDGVDPIVIPTVDHYLDQLSSPLEIAGLSIQVLLTPGHTKGGVSFLVEDAVFTGDTLFRGKIGRSDLPGADKFVLRESLARLGGLSPKTIVYPGHGDPSTIGEELAYNPAFREACL